MPTTDGCMPFCDGRAHGVDEEFDWDCVYMLEWTGTAGQPGRVWIQGAHGDHVRVEIDQDVSLYEPEDVDNLIQALTVLRPLLAAASPLADCAGCSVCEARDAAHEAQADDEEDEDAEDDPIICDECRQPVRSTWHVDNDRWLCTECCTAAGIPAGRG